MVDNITYYENKNVCDLRFPLICIINTSYLTDSYISFTLKLPIGQKFYINWWFSSSTYVKKNIFDFPPCGKRKREGGKISTIVYHFHKQNFLLAKLLRSRSAVVRRESSNSRIGGTKPGAVPSFFFCVELFYHVCMHTNCIHNGAKPFKKSHLNLQKKNPRDQEYSCIDMQMIILPSPPYSH